MSKFKASMDWSTELETYWLEFINEEKERIVLSEKYRNRSNDKLHVST